MPDARLALVERAMSDAVTALAQAPESVNPITFVAEHMGRTGEHRHLASPVTRAVSLAHLEEDWNYFKEHGPYTWEAWEYMPKDHPDEKVTAETLQAHRDVRRAAELARNGVRRKVQY